MFKIVPGNIQLSKILMLLVRCTNPLDFSHDVAISFAHIEFTAVSHLENLISVLKLAVLFIFFELVFFYEFCGPVRRTLRLSLLL